MSDSWSGCFWGNSLRMWLFPPALPALCLLSLWKRAELDLFCLAFGWNLTCTCSRTLSPLIHFISLWLPTNLTGTVSVGLASRTSRSLLSASPPPDSSCDRPLWSRNVIKSRGMDFSVSQLLGAAHISKVFGGRRLWKATKQMRNLFNARGQKCTKCARGQSSTRAERQRSFQPCC